MALAALCLFIVGAANQTAWTSLIAGLGVALFTANTTYFRYRQRQFVVNRIGIIVAFALEVVYLIPAGSCCFGLNGKPSHSGRRSQGSGGRSLSPKG